MKNQWYCGVEGQQYGPFTWEQLRAMAAEGRIVADSFVRRDVDQQWFQASQVPGLLPKARASGAAGKGDPSKSSPSQKRAAVPSGTAVSNSSANIPVGRPVVVAPVSVAAPVGVAVAAPSGPVFVAPIAATTSAQTADAPEPAKKGNNTLLIVGVLGGACALVAVIGIGVLVWSLTRDSEPPEQQVANAIEGEMRVALEKMASELAENPPTEFKPVDGGGVATASAPAAAPPAAAAKVMNSIQKWTDVTQLRAISLNSMKLSVGSAWLAADETGTRVEPSATAAAAKFVFVEMRITNVAPVARKYKSWNAMAGTSVVLADQNNDVLSLVPASATPAANRLAAVDIQPGQTVRDVLVFSAPGGAVEKLHLALAKSALAENAKFRGHSHFALEIPLEVLLTKRSSEGAPAQAAGPIAANQATPLEADMPMPLAIGSAEPQPAAAPEPLKKGDRPPTKEELNKQFEKLAGEEGKPEAKKGEAQK